MEEIIQWFTVLNAGESTRRIRTENREVSLAVWSYSETARRAVSVEWPALKPDW